MPNTCDMLSCQFSTVLKSLFLLNPPCSCPRISLVPLVIKPSWEFMFSLKLFQLHHFPGFKPPVLLVQPVFAVPMCACLSCTTSFSISEYTSSLLCSLKNQQCFFYLFTPRLFFKMLNGIVSSIQCYKITLSAF